MSLRIGMILDVDFPPDDRPEKEALSLIEAGHKLFLLCYTQTEKPAKEEYRGIRITRFRLSRFLHNKLSAAYLVLPIYRWIWAFHIKKFIEDNQLNILHVHDLMLSDIAVKLAQKYNLKVVCDQHEYWSSWIVNTFHYNTPLGKIVKFLSNWKKFEKKYLQQADLVITVSENLRKRYIAETGLTPQKTITVPNTPAKDVFNSDNINPEITKRYSTKFVLFYAGVIDILRGVELIIKSLPLLKKDIPNIQLILAGRLSKGSKIFDLARELDVESEISFIGWLPVAELPSYIGASNICFFTPPIDKSEEIHITIVTKIYQYTLMKKPIIVSGAKMMKEYIEENHLGFALEEYSEIELAKKIKHIYENYPSISMEIAQNAANLVRTGNFYWEQTVKPMIEKYKKYC